MQNFKISENQPSSNEAYKSNFNNYAQNHKSEIAQSMIVSNTSNNESNISNKLRFGNNAQRPILSLEETYHKMKHQKGSNGETGVSENKSMVPSFLANKANNSLNDDQNQGDKKEVLTFNKGRRGSKTKTLGMNGFETERGLQIETQFTNQTINTNFSNMKHSAILPQTNSFMNTNFPPMTLNNQKQVQKEKVEQPSSFTNNVVPTPSFKTPQPVKVETSQASTEGTCKTTNPKSVFLKKKIQPEVLTSGASEDNGLKKCESITELPANFSPFGEEKIKKEDFMIGKKMGKGQFGQVFLVQHKKTGFLCAMKTMEKKQIREEKYEGQIARELSIQFYLSHRNITPLYGYFEDQQNVYLLV